VKAIVVENPDTIVNVIGIAYGIVLILAAFVRSRITEAMRVDALFMKQASEQTRPLNLIFGILVAGYGIYSLIV
jgi:F0F1-type ATP synthase membrane subunit c/vacuolar-type H+-ATPase subunit K